MTIKPYDLETTRPNVGEIRQLFELHGRTITRACMEDMGDRVLIELDNGHMVRLRVGFSGAVEYDYFRSPYDRTV